MRLMWFSRSATDAPLHKNYQNVAEPRTESSNCRQIFCPHCDEFVPKSTYYRHRDLYFCHHSNQWLTDSELIIIAFVVAL